jgi:hypothetical protein
MDQHIGCTDDQGPAQGVVRTNETAHCLEAWQSCNSRSHSPLLLLQGVP